MSRYVVAVDVGGTSIKAALVDADGKVRSERVEATPLQLGPSGVVERLRTIISALAAEPGVGAVGLVVPGAVDPQRGIATFSANIGWRDVPLRQLITADTGLAVALDHDVRAAGVAEQAFGATHEVSSSLLVVIGTGVAAVVSVGGEIVRGANSTAGELGHISVDSEGEPCPCGQRGCLERYASAAGISRRYAALSGTAGVPAEEIVARLRNDGAAATVWSEAVTALAIGLTSATLLLDPAVIVLAGGLAEAGDALLTPLAAELAERLTWRPAPPLVRSALGTRAGMLGAAVLAWRLLQLR